jgi:hypothetical protein
LFLLAGGVLVLLLQFFGFPTPDDFKAAAKDRQSRSANPANRWGDLEVIPIMLERPPEYFAFDPPPPEKITWFFEQQTPPQLLDFFMACGLSDHELSLLTDTNQWRVTPQGIAIQPGFELLRDLEPAPRERIYGLLAESTSNPAQRYPDCYRSDRFQAWFDQCDLTPEQVNMVEKMTYRRKGMLCFSDQQYLHHTLAPEARLKVARTLARVPSLLVKLRVTPDSDLDSLLAYWGTSGRLPKVKPLLESVRRTPKGSALSVTWLFPPVPRLLLYSYPHPTNTIASGKYADCFWTSLNFFNETPDPRCLETSFQSQVLKSDYHTVPKADTFGDLILLYEPLGADIKTVHMCVYIADDIVFTKNGYDFRHPWVLMRMDDMMIHYSPEKPLAQAVFRRNQR